MDVQLMGLPCEMGRVAARRAVTDRVAGVLGVGGVSRGEIGLGNAIPEQQGRPGSFDLFPRGRGEPNLAGLPLGAGTAARDPIPAGSVIQGAVRVTAAGDLRPEAIREGLAREGTTSWIASRRNRSCSRS